MDQLFKQNQKSLGNFVALAWKDGKIVFYDDIYDEDRMLKERYFAGK